MDALYDESTLDALRGLREDVASLIDLMAPSARPAVEHWVQAIDRRLLPRLRPGFPLVAAICGGGSSGKSTLFNTLTGKLLSPTGGRAGINRRMLIALSAQNRDRADIAEALFEPFHASPQLLETIDQLTTPGDPLLCYADTLPSELALVDTPDFDTGAKGSYQNRKMAESALQAADVLVYIFTNANYNNRDNTDFIARMLTTVGTRTCFLVYRADRGFSDQEIREHAATVANHLYGATAAQHVRAVYRADEDNRVATGGQPMTLVPLEPQRGSLSETLIAMDPRQVRGDLHRSIFSDAVAQGEQFYQAVQDAGGHLRLYLDGLRAVQRQCVQEALGHLPMDAVLRRFSEIWQATDPSHVRIMRQTGKVVETPVRLMMRLAKWVGGSRRKNGMPAGDEAAAAMETDFVKAAGRLRQAALSPVLEVGMSATDPAGTALRDAARQLAGKGGVSTGADGAGGVTIKIPLPPVLTETQAALGGQAWATVVDDMLVRQDALLGLTAQLEAELHRLADEQRERMTTFDQLRQTFSAMLNIIPATAAVTYVLHTGDPVGAVGIKVKLAGLFGLNDLYALVAIPATAGMKKADLRQLEALLGPVAQAWLTHKLTAIEALFEEEITGALLQRGQAVIDDATRRFAAASRHVARCKDALERQP